MEKIIIREAMAEDAGQIIAYTKIVGGETENLTFGEAGFPACFCHTIVCDVIDKARAESPVKSFQPNHS